MCGPSGPSALERDNARIIQGARTEAARPLEDRVIDAQDGVGDNGFDPHGLSLARMEQFQEDLPMYSLDDPHLRTAPPKYVYDTKTSRHKGSITTHRTKRLNPEYESWLKQSRLRHTRSHLFGRR